MSVETGGRTTKGQPEVGIKAARFKWGRIVAVAAVFVVLAGVCVRYYTQTFIGLGDREAMDIAQVARNITRGKGFVTGFIRPFNLTLIPPGTNDTAELNHPPLYAYVLGAAIKVKGPTDQTVALTSIFFLYLTLCATFVLGVVLFDWRVGLLAMAAVGVSAPVLRAGASGQEWSFAAMLFTLLLILVALHHKFSTGGRRSLAIVCAAAAGLLVGSLYLTDRILVVLLAPLAVYFATAGRGHTQQAEIAPNRVARRVSLAALGRTRAAHVVVFLALAMLLIAPWGYRDMEYTGVPLLGINAFDLMANTSAFPGDTLYRQTDRASQSIWTALLFPVDHFGDCGRKLLAGASDLSSALMAALGLATAAFAVVSTLYKFKKPAVNAVRGLMYGVLPVLVVLFALYGVGKSAMVIFAPIAAVIAAAYFILLLDTKKLHVFFMRVLVAAFVIVSAFPALVPLCWKPNAEEALGGNMIAQRYFGNLGTRGVHSAMFTDVPWLAAWRTMGWGVWLPRTDADAMALSAKALPMRVIVLTPESESYPREEIWFVLHKVKAWRDYMADRQKALGQILEAVGIDPKNKAGVDRYVQRMKRQFAVSNSLEGFVPQAQDPLAPDDLQSFVLDETRQ